MRWHKFVIPIVLVVGAMAAAGGIAAAWALNIYHSAPPLKDLKPVQKGRSSAIYTAEGKLIGYIHSENVRQPITGGEIPKVLKNATISIEDKDFWKHGALDAAGIALRGRLFKRPTVLTYHCDLQLPEGLFNRTVDQAVFAANYISAVGADRIVAYTRDYADHSRLLRKFGRKLVGRCALQIPVITRRPPDVGFAGHVLRGGRRLHDRAVRHRRSDACRLGGVSAGARSSGERAADPRQKGRCADIDPLRHGRPRRRPRLSAHLRGGIY